MKIVDNLLPEELADKYYNFGLDVVSGRSDANHVWTNKAWDESIVKDSAVVVCIKLPDYFLDELQSVLLKNNIFNSEKDIPLNVSKSAIIYVWFKNSYIPVHTDSDYTKSVTVYLNRKWEYNYGGMFNWFDKDKNEWKNIMPIFNRAVVNDSGYLHGITPVKSHNSRITLQVFLHPIT